MRKKNLILLLLTGLIGIASANASAAVTITALKSPVWVQQGSSKSELGRNSKLKVGDNIATGDAGRVEMQLWVNATLQLNSNSEITIRPENGTDVSAADGHPELYLHRGRACINYQAQSSSEKKLVVNLGDMMFAAIHLDGDVCVLRSDGLSAIKLRSGSVQVTHAVDPNMIILSETGTEMHIEDNGSYDLLFPGIEQSSSLEIEKPFVIETVAEKAVPADPAKIVAGKKTATGELTQAEFEATAEEDVPARSLVTVDKNNAATDEPGAAVPGISPQNEVSDYIYTVYLFSTRDADVAERVNRKFQQAGHDTRILENTSGSVLYYRVGAPGFESRQAAKNFSDAIVGTLGVTQTWIGKERPFVAETVVAEDAAGGSVEAVDSDNVTAGQTTAVKAGISKQEGQTDYIYTVYLFATRFEKVAEQFNRNFQRAGHNTQIFESTSGSVLYYRVGAPGFESRQAANAFSDSVVGKHGVTETWIGKELR